MIEQKFGTFLSRYRLTGICCAEKIGLDIHRKANCVRLFKAFLSRYRLTGICCAEKIGLDIHRKANCVRLFKV